MWAACECVSVAEQSHSAESNKDVPLMKPIFDGVRLNAADRRSATGTPLDGEAPTGLWDDERDLFTRLGGRRAVRKAVNES